MNFNRFKILDYLLLILICIGIIFALLNYFHFRSLWLDEAMLSLNIVNRSFAQLLLPLDMVQVAPIGFLMIEKSFVSIFGNHDYVLRIFPLISYLLSVPLFYILSLQIVKDKRFALFATAIFSLSTSIIEYSSEVKQYSTDVFIVILLVLSTLLYLDSNYKYKNLLFGLIGSISIWFSNISVILLFSLGLYYLYQELTKSKNNKNYKVFIPVFTWFFMFVFYYFMFIYNHPAWSRQVSNWENLDAFIPKSIFNKAFYISLFSKAKMVLGLFRFGSFLFIPAIFTVSGIYFLYKINRGLLFILWFPVLVHFTLSYLRLYPFYPRLILYQTPLMIIVYSTGIYFAFDLVTRKIIKLPKLFLLVPVIICLWPLYKVLPIEKEEIKDGLEFINENISFSDNLYVSFATRPAFLFYKDNYPNIKSNRNIKMGSVLMKRGEDYDFYEILNDDIKNIKGKTWIVFSHEMSMQNESSLYIKDVVMKEFMNRDFHFINKKQFVGGVIYKVE